MRKLFGTDGIRGKADEYPLTPEDITKIGEAFAAFLNNNLQKEKIMVAVGKDTRLSSQMVENSLTAGMQGMGVNVTPLGVITTNGTAYSAKFLKADAAIMITASHNPAEDNGIKFMDGEGFKFADKEEEEIEKIFFSGIKAGGKVGSVYATRYVKQNYIEFLQGTIHNASLSGLKIVVDAANGSASKYAYDVFRNLDAEVKVINDQPDGLNINKDCGAMFPEAVAEEVKKEKADAGIALDGDADRLIMCDENGKAVDGDCIMAVVALELKKQGKLEKNTLVATQYSNLALDDFMKAQGIKVVRAAPGDRYVLEKIRKEGYNFGGEQSGHFIFYDYATTGDGMLSALQVLKIMKDSGKKLSALSGIVKPYPQMTVNVKVREKKQLEGTELIKMAAQAGKRIGGRVFIRYSGTEMLLRIMLEGRNEKEIKTTADELAKQAEKELGK